MKKIIALFKQGLGYFKEPKVRSRMLIAMIAVAAVFGGYFYLNRQGRIILEDSQVTAAVINVTPDGPGKLVKLNVYEGDTVQKGDELAIVGTQMLRAEVGGLIIKTPQSIGSVVSPQTPVVVMVNPDDLRVVGIIDENKGLENIKTGQVVSFIVDAVPGKTFWGYVDRVAQTAKSTQLSFSISSERPVQQFEVYVRFDARKYQGIKNGMSAKMTVFTKLP